MCRQYRKRMPRILHKNDRYVDLDHPFCNNGCRPCLNRSIRIGMPILLITRNARDTHKQVTRRNTP
ncbi:hypothetical protein D3C75_640800 [compost metagenome]